MSGQDSISSAFTDTMVALKDTLAASVFALSTTGDNMGPAEGGILMQQIRSIPATWLFIYLFVLLGFFAWIRLYYGHILTQTIQASTNFQVATRIFKDNSLLQKQLDNVLYGLYFLSVAFLLYLIEDKLSWIPYRLQGGFLYLFNLALLVGIFFVRMVLINLTGFLFNRLRLFREYLYNTFIFNKLIGVITLPLLLFIVYTTGTLQQLFFWVVWAAVILVLVLRTIRGIVFSFKKGVSIFYMFLYLCALELIPLALLYKWLEGIL